MGYRTNKLILLLLLLSSCATTTPIKVLMTVDPAQTSGDIIVFTTNSNYSWLKRTTELANCVSNNKDFIEEVRQIKSFYFSTDTGAQVAEHLTSPEQTSLGTFKGWTIGVKKSNATARRKDGRVQFNVRRNPRSAKSMVNTAIHERTHKWYSHNGNYKTIENLNSVPYRVGSASEKYVESCLK